MRGCYLEYDRCLLERNGVLRRKLVGERVAPWESDAQLGESKLQELELAEVLVQQIPRYVPVNEIASLYALQLTCNITACASHGVLSAPLQRRTLGSVAVRILSVRVGDCVPDGCCPVNFIRHFPRHKYHRRLVRHSGGGKLALGKRDDGRRVQVVYAFLVSVGSQQLKVMSRFRQ